MALKSPCVKERGRLFVFWLLFFVAVVVLNWFQLKTPRLKLESAATTARTRSG